MRQDVATTARAKTAPNAAVADKSPARAVIIMATTVITSSVVSQGMNRCNDMR
jgi:hypothetical protein